MTAINSTVVALEEASRLMTDILWADSPDSEARELAGACREDIDEMLVKWRALVGQRELPSDDESDPYDDDLYGDEEHVCRCGQHATAVDDRGNFYCDEHAPKESEVAQ